MARRLASKTDRPVEVKLVPRWRRAIGTLFVWRSSTHSLEGGSDSDANTIQSHPRNVASRVRPDMIRRMDDAPKLINPSGWISEPDPPPTPASEANITQQPTQLQWSASAKSLDSSSESQRSEEPSESSDDTMKHRVKDVYVPS